MDTLTAVHNSALADYMASAHLSQAELAATVGKSQSWLSKRLNGSRRWTLDDLDRLIEAGVPVSLSLYGSLEDF